MNDIVRAADLVVIAERARAAALRGDDLDLGALTRLEGAADRAVRRLGIKPGANAPKPISILGYAARKAAEKAASASDGDAADRRRRSAFSTPLTIQRCLSPDLRGRPGTLGAPP